jgi:hypothetical protein
VSVSALLLSACLLSLAPPILETAATWRQRNIMVTEQLWRYNSESLLAFASLALVMIGLIIIWTSYQKRTRSAWCVMLVFVLFYFIPVYFVDIFLNIKTVGWSWSRQFAREILQGQPLALTGLRYLTTLGLMIIALVIPIRAFFGKNGRVRAGESALE